FGVSCLVSGISRLARGDFGTKEPQASAHSALPCGSRYDPTTKHKTRNAKHPEERARAGRVPSGRFGELVPAVAAGTTAGGATAGPGAEGECGDYECEEEFAHVSVLPWGRVLGRHGRTCSLV